MSEKAVLGLRFRPRGISDRRQGVTDCTLLSSLVRLIRRRTTVVLALHSVLMTWPLMQMAKFLPS